MTRRPLWIDCIVTCAAAHGGMAGAMGCADLDPAMPSWRTPVASEAFAGAGGDFDAAVGMDASSAGANPPTEPPPADTGNGSVADLGGSITTDISDAGAIPEAPDRRGLVTASLHVEGANLVALVRNFSGVPATLGFSVSVDTPVGAHLLRDAGERLVAGGETLSVRWPSGTLEGFDVASGDWSRAVLVYQFVLQDGRQGTQTTELAIRNGRVVPPEEALAEHWRMPDAVLDDSAPPEPTAGDFKACLRNVVDLRPVLADGAPTPCPFGVDDETGAGCVNGLDLLAQNHQVRPIRGQVFSYTAPDGASGSATVDAAGCTPRLVRQVGDWQFRLYLAVHRDGPAQTVYFLDDEGRLAFADTKVHVEAQGNPATTDVRVAFEQRPFQAALLLSQNTLERAQGLEALPPTGLHLRISPWAVSESTPEFAHGSYCHAFGMGCTAPRTLRVHSRVAHDRGLIAHETGHFIQAENLDCPSCDPPSSPYPYDYSYTNASASDGCIRTENGYDSDSIEWQPAAHLEGLAGFFASVSYNDYGTKADCQLPEYADLDDRVGLRDCEAPGMTPAPCLEWQTTALLGLVDNALDWTKLYWDFLTDSPGANFGMYMRAERNMAGIWPADGHGNHFERISFELRAIDESVGMMLRNVRGGNIFNGVAH